MSNSIDQLATPLITSIKRMGVIAVLALVVWFAVRYYAVQHFSSKGWPAKRVQATADFVAHLGFGAVILVGFFLVFKH